MFDDETVVQDTINPAENDTPENDGQETVEDPPEDASAEGETTGNEEPDYYEAQLRDLQEENERLKEEAEERKRQIAVKDRAILAQRSKLRQAAQPSSVDAEKLKADIKRDLQVDAAISAIAKSEAEAKLIRHHYETSIVKKGDVGKDIDAALAVANAPRIKEILDASSLRDAADDRSLSSLRGEGVRGYAPSARSAFRTEVEKLVPKEARRHLDKYVPR
jgi:hypothetical protein